jgi:D-cysteine desulfhydrase
VASRADARRRGRELPLVARFPGLADLPRASLIRWPTPVLHAASLAPSLWIKRDDLCADPLGGNKVRALEFLMGGAEPETTFVTVGSAGSTHALAVATYARRLGAKARVGRWRQQMNASAAAVSSAIERTAPPAPVFRNVAAAYAWAALQRGRGARWIPAGASSPLGVLGHVNAALELADQITAGVLPEPRRIIVPLGTGGTMAGLALGVRIAGLSTAVIGVRVVPRAVANRMHVARLARRTASLIERHAGALVHLPRLRAHDLAIDQQEFGGAYGRVTDRATEAARRFELTARIRLDLTYTAKAAAAALSLAENAEGPSLFWLTFDARGV